MSSSLEHKDITRDITDALICIPIWGHKYIDKFLDITIHSYFSAKNIPGVSSVLKTRLVLLTNPEGRKNIEESLVFKRFVDQIPVTFIDIQDLIIDSQYTFTLTMAYARAINSIESSKIGHTLVVVLNADFFLSDESLLNVAKKAMSGHQAIYGASLRCKYEETSKTLRRDIRNLGLSSVFDSRKLVELTLQNLHPTVTAMTLNNGFCYYSQLRQIFFRVDDTCLLAHKYLLCIIGLVPQKHIKEVNSYHDYSFVPELTSPDARYVFDDSDQYFAMELQDTYSEASFIRLGQPKVTQLAKSIDSWIMDEHRWASKSQIVFHSGELRPDLYLFSSEFRKLHIEVDSLIKQSKRSHVNHYHWTSGALLWKSKRQKILGRSVSFEEIEPKIRKISPSERLYAYFKYPTSTWRLAKHSLRDFIARKLRSLYGYIFLSEELRVYRSLTVSTSSAQAFDCFKDFRTYVIEFEHQVGEKSIVLLCNPSELSSMCSDLKYNYLEIPDCISLDILIVRNSRKVKSQDRLIIEFFDIVAASRRFEINSRVQGTFITLFLRQASKSIFRLFREASLPLKFLLFAPCLILLPIVLAMSMSLRFISKRRVWQSRKGSFVLVRLRHLGEV